MSKEKIALELFKQALTNPEALRDREVSLQEVSYEGVFEGFELIVRADPADMTFYVGLAEKSPTLVRAIVDISSYDGVLYLNVMPADLANGLLEIIEKSLNEQK